MKQTNKRWKNHQMERMINTLQPLLTRRDEIGYYAARNYRALAECLTEYTTIKNDLITKYGEKNENGTTGVKIGTPEFIEFDKEFGPIADIEHSCIILCISYSKIIGQLSGEEILNLEWMLYEEVNQNDTDGKVT